MANTIMNVKKLKNKLKLIGQHTDQYYFINGRVEQLNKWDCFFFFFFYYFLVL